ncbi:MAG: T9SS type A sorting domain-containing protein [Bacteroidetes bacterium]|nr:T9SS type A sorting domain-containing protein [Bacteroidota bacterium]
MKKLYHYGRKQRQLKYRLKEAGKAQREGNRARFAFYEEKLKGLWRFANRSMLSKALALGLITMLPVQLNAQDLIFQPSTDSTYLYSNVYDIFHELPDTFTNFPGAVVNRYGHGSEMEFVDLDDDGDEDVLFSIYQQTYYHQEFLTLLFFQENLTEDEVHFGDPQLLWYNYDSYWPMAIEVYDPDEDGDWDILVNSRELFVALENHSGVPDSFRLDVDTVLTTNTNLTFTHPDLVDIDMDGDEDIVTLLVDSSVMKPRLFYRENDGSPGLFPFDDTWTPFGHVFEMELLPVHRVGVLNGIDFADLDEDGNVDLLIQAYFEEDDLEDPWDYYPREKRLLFFENQSNSGYEFLSTGFQLLETDIHNGNNGTDPGAGTKTYYNITDWNRDGDLEILEPVMYGHVYCSYCGESTEFFYMLLHENVSGESLLQGRVFADLNSNSILDDGETMIPNVSVSHLPAGGMKFTNQEGLYYFFADTGNHVIQPNYESTIWNVVPDQYVLSIDSMITLDTLDFAFQPIAQNTDLSITAVGSPVRPGFPVSYHLLVNNLGMITENPMVHMVVDEELEFRNADPSGTNHGDSLVWTLPALQPFEEAVINVSFMVSQNTPLGDTIGNSYIVYPRASDVDPQNNSFTTEDIVTGSFDYNDKQVYPIGQGPAGIVPLTTDLFTYTIRFQNVDTDTAFNIVVLDTMDTDLDLQSFQLVDASHDNNFHLTEEGIATWAFDNIGLPDSTTDLDGSNGYIQYSIEPANNVTGIQVTNEAYIFFDFNAPVKTRTTVNTFDVALSSNAQNHLSTKIYPNPSTQYLEVSIKNPGNEKVRFELYSTDGKLILIEEFYGETLQIKRNGLLSGTYSFYMDSGNERASGNIVFVED